MNVLIFLLLYTCLEVKRYCIINPTTTPMVFAAITFKIISQSLEVMTSRTVTKTLIAKYVKNALS